MKRTIEVSDINKKYKNPVAELVEAACGYSSHIGLECNGKNINAKSLMGVMAFGLKKGMVVNISTEGDDCELALDGISDFLSA